MTPKIDNVAINSRPDWTHALRPAQQPMVEESFPGVAQRFIRQGARMPEDLVLTGPLTGTGATVAEAVTTLISAQRSLEAKINDGQLHTVQVHNSLWSAMVLVEVNSISEVIPVRVSSGYAVKRYVQLYFRATRSAYSIVEAPTP